MAKATLHNYVYRKLSQNRGKIRRMNSPEYAERCQFLLDQIRNSPHHDGACMTHQQNYERIRR